MSNFELFYSGDQYYLRLLEEIGRAEKEILFESYIFDADEIGNHVLMTLARAVERGVRVRILVDGVGSAHSINKLKDSCAKYGIAFRVYHPLPFNLASWKLFSVKRIKRWVYMFRRINKRNHRKTILIDREKVFLGSYNISRVHSERLSKTQAWRDTGFFASFPEHHGELKILVDAYMESWRSARFFARTNWKAFLKRGKKIKQSVHQIFRLNNRPLWRFFLLRDLNRRIRNAQSRIYITNAYFLPRKSLLRNLRRAGRRGIDVRLLLPEKSDAWFVREAARSLFSRLLKSNIRIFEFRNRVLHAKTLIIDDWATVGSHNLNHRSMMHDLEVEAVVIEPKLLQSLLDQWNLDLKNTTEIKAKDFNKTWWPRRILSRILYWFRFWV